MQCLHSRQFMTSHMASGRCSRNLKGVIFKFILNTDRNITVYILHDITYSTKVTVKHLVTCSKETPHTSPSQVSYGMLIVSVLQKMTAIHWEYTPDSKVHGANMWPTWVLSAPDGPHVGPMNLAIRDCIKTMRPMNPLLWAATMPLWFWKLLAQKCDNSSTNTFGVNAVLY